MGFLITYSNIVLTLCIRLVSWWMTGREEDNPISFASVPSLTPSPIPAFLIGKSMHAALHLALAQPLTPYSQGLWLPQRQVRGRTLHSALFQASSIECAMHLEALLSYV